MNTKEINALILDIARDCIPSVETLEVRSSDALDFHDVHVSAIREALHRAFAAGRATAEHQK